MDCSLLPASRCPETPNANAACRAIQNINFQGADLGRAGSEGTLCGPGAIELPGCLSGVGCAAWSVDGSVTNGQGVVAGVVVQNVRLSDAVLRADVQVGGRLALPGTCEPL